MQKWLTYILCKFLRKQNEHLWFGICWVFISFIQKTINLKNFPSKDSFYCNSNHSELWKHEMLPVKFQSLFCFQQQAQIYTTWSTTQWKIPARCYPSPGPGVILPRNGRALGIRSTTGTGNAQHYWHCWSSPGAGRAELAQDLAK